MEWVQRKEQQDWGTVVHLPPWGDRESEYRTVLSVGNDGRRGNPQIVGDILHRIAEARSVHRLG